MTGSGLFVAILTQTPVYLVWLVGVILAYRRLEKTSIRLPGCLDRLRGPVSIIVGDPAYYCTPRRKLEPDRHCLLGSIDPGGRLGSGPGCHLRLEEVKPELFHPA